MSKKLKHSILVFLNSASFFDITAIALTYVLAGVIGACIYHYANGLHLIG